MGTTIKYESIDIKHPYLFINTFLHQFFLDPFFALLLAFIFTPPLAQVYGMFVISLTPSTAAASVSTYTVDGDVPLALALSMMSLLASVVFTPFMFTVLLKIYSRYTSHSNSDKIELPHLRMFYLMSYVMFLISIGYKLRQKAIHMDNKESQNDDKGRWQRRVDKFGLYCQRSSIVFMLTAFGCYFASASFIRSMTPNNPYSYFGSMLILIFGQLIFAFIPICQIEEKKKDAVVLVTTRRSPGIALAIAALSFQKVDYYGEIIGYVLVYGMVRDWSTLPYIMILRKRRIGHYFFSRTKELDEESDELDETL
jgi:predicted Na+-dependent transporter